MKPIFIFLFLVVAFSACKHTDPPPNVIIFYSDELDPQYVSAYGGNFQTPNLDILAREGIRFTSAYTAAPMCTPSRFSVLTGKLPGRCIHPEFLRAYPMSDPYVVAWNTYLEGNIPTIASVLSKNGYVTGMAGKWHIGKIPEETKLPDLPADADLDDPMVEQKLKDHQDIVSQQVKHDAGFDHAYSVMWTNFDNFQVTSLRVHNFPWITKGAITFLEEARKSRKPFFLYVATTAVHGPGHADVFNRDLSYTLEGRMDDHLKYQLPSDSMRKVLEDIPPALRHKHAGMACLDNHVKNVINKLKELGLDENTMIFFMADHNVEPGKATCYEKGLKVPMIIKMPDGMHSGSVNGKLTSNVDIFPTILEAANIPIPEGLLLDGISILPGIRNENIHTRPYVFAESGLTRSVNDGRWKYIAFRYPGDQIEKMQSGAIDYAPNFLNLEKQAHSSIAMEHFPGYFSADQLYDLETDPYELRNLAYDPDYSDELKRLQKVLADHLSSFSHSYDMSDTSFMTTDEYKKLVEKSLSYGTDYIPWLRRDHGSIHWPPVE